MDTLKFRLQGLHCEACVKLSTIRLKNISGVQEVKINLESGETTIVANRKLDFAEIEKVFLGTDYKALKE